MSIFSLRALSHLLFIILITYCLFRHFLPFRSTIELRGGSHWSLTRFFHEQSILSVGESVRWHLNMMRYAIVCVFPFSATVTVIFFFFLVMMIDLLIISYFLIRHHLLYLLARIDWWKFKFWRRLRALPYLSL